MRTNDLGILTEEEKQKEKKGKDLAASVITTSDKIVKLRKIVEEKSQGLTNDENNDT